MPTEETVTIPLSEYEDLKRSSLFLSRLEAAGVDNWEGYDLAFEDEDEDDWA